jgi:hypothetical protein
MKSNFISGIIKNPIELQDISSIYKIKYPQSKLHIIEKGQVYSRVLGEIPIAHNYTTRFQKYFENNIFTGDSLVTDRKGQTNPDLIQRMKNFDKIKEIESDIKAGNNMVKHPLKGTIGQITYNNNQINQINLPNDPILPTIARNK